MMRSGRGSAPRSGSVLKPSEDGGGDVRGFEPSPCTLDRPDQHPARKALGEPVQNVANDGAGRRRDDADHRRDVRQELLSRFVEQSFRGEPALALFEQRHERAKARYGSSVSTTIWYCERPG